MSRAHPPSALAIAIVATFCFGAAAVQSCDVYARTQAGLVCGARRTDARGATYASFRGVPYAQQPLGELRFKSLQPLQPWEGVLNATAEGPVCPQTDILYGRLATPSGMSEACIHANIHVPLAHLPDLNQRPVRELQPPYPLSYTEKPVEDRGLPILVFIHGGGFAFGSGDADLHGPEYLVSEDVIVVTFNYRLNVFGFLSLNSSSIPGNNGLRDMVTLLRWVKTNARYFGGDASRVTLAGQSAGASSAHLLALSPAAKGLFQRVILMSGTAIPSFLTTSPTYAQYIAGQFLAALGINATDPDEVHKRLTNTPLETLMTVNSLLQDATGLVVFLPVVESPHEGIETIIDADTEIAILSGRDSKLPMLVGFTNVECEVFRPRFEQIDILTMIQKNPTLTVPPHLLFTQPQDMILNSLKLVDQRYYNSAPTMEKFLNACTQMYFQYPALRVAEYRQKLPQAAPIYLYEFAYNADISVLKEALNLTYNGAAHIEDLTYIFRANSVPVERSANDVKTQWMMTSHFKNFIIHGYPSGNKESECWKPVDSTHIQYRLIDCPCEHKNQKITDKQRELLDFMNRLMVTG